MNFFDLAYTTPDILEKMKAAELRGAYNEHLDSITSDGCLPVDEYFPYIPGPGRAFVYWCERTFYLHSFINRLNRNYFHTRVVGKENLRGIKGAVYICNHVNKYDALVVNYAFGSRRLKIMTADFNNRPGALGSLMRSDGILPFKNSRPVVHKFTEAVNWYLRHGTGVLFFPEGSEWWCYRKPRPFMDGAFHFAAANNVPVVPLFITFTDSGRMNASGVSLPYFTINILEPLYPDDLRTKSDNTKLLKEQSYDAWVRAYKNFYKTPLN
jgi:1-acyl-sn-glycerol-3-phosphate acyltransferase